MNILENNPHTNADVTDTSSEVLAKAPDRSILIIQNPSDTDIYIRFGTDPAVVGQGMVINKGATLLLDAIVFGTAIQAIHDGEGNKTILITEG